MTKKSMGYPLPSGDASESDLQCMILFYPDRAEYRQALFGSLDYLATWLAWETDEDKRGKDAAASWRAAVQATRECIEMSTCETILSLLREIRDNTGIYCCDVVDISDGDRFTDEVEDGVGDVPQNIIDAGYAEDAADWDGFYNYKCMISHLMVDNLKAQVETILSAIDQSGAVLVGVVALAAIAATILTAGGAVLAYGIVLGLIGVAGLSAALAEIGEAALPDLLDAIDEHHDDLACAIYNADGSVNAVVALKAEIDALFSGVQAALLTNLNIPAPLKALYSGRYDQQDIAQIMADDGYDVLDYECDCEIDYGEWQSPMEEGDGGTLLFMVNNGWTFYSSGGNPTGNDNWGWRKPYQNPSGEAEATVIAVRGATGLATGTGKDMTVNRITFDMMRTAGGAGVLKLTIGADVTTYTDRVGAWETVEYVPSSPIYRDRNAQCFQFEINSGGSSGYTHIDNVMVDFDGPP